MFSGYHNESKWAVTQWAVTPVLGQHIVVRPSEGGEQAVARNSGLQVGIMNSKPALRDWEHEAFNEVNNACA
jgi:hypothetical protein